MQCFVAYHHHKNFSNFLGASRGSVSLGAWFGFAFLAAVLCELCGKGELDREERQGSQRTQSKSLGQGANCTTTYALKRINEHPIVRPRRCRPAIVSFPEITPLKSRCPMLVNIRRKTLAALKYVIPQTGIAHRN